jgi:CRISPR/Cas system CSM-associated protein Csm3 (group 7 of RAMP superfamily)
MARKIHSRLKISGTLVAETPLHIGGFGESADTDLPLAQNGKGELYIPGTSIAGVLRSWCEKNFGEDLTSKLFAPKRERGKEEGYASFVLIEDATIENADEVLTEIRDGVGIDRFYGVAADKAKYDRAVLPRGTKLNFVMTVEIGAQKEPDKNSKNDEDKKDESQKEFETRDKETKAVIGNLLAAFTESKVRFGAARTRGLGRVKLTGKKKEDGEYESEPEIKEQSFIGFDNILNLLNDNGNARSITDLKNATSLSTISAPRLEINITWKPRLPVMVKAGYDGIGVDMLPLTSGVKNGELALCLPGSSIKGVLRSHAERIMRTMLDCKDEKEELRTKNKPNFHDQIDSVPLIEKLFGARSKSKDNNNGKPPANNKGQANPQAKPGLGALAIDDCYAKEKHQMKIDGWRAVEIGTVNNDTSAEQWDLQKKLKAIPNASFLINHHVAIDRWTGGASEGALYSVLAPIEMSWNDMSLTLDFGRIEKESQLPALMLLLLVLRDVAENRLPFGFATNRGMGEIEVEDMCLKGSGFENELSCLNTSSEEGLVLSKGKFTNLNTKLKEDLKREWGEWRKQNQQT